jgi:hypothetical protein
MAFGVVMFGTTPYALPNPSTPSEERGQVTSSRKIDIRRRFVQTNSGKGDFEGMTDVQQRVLILLARNVVEPDRIGIGFEQELRLQIENALAPLTRGPRAVAEVLDLRVEDFGGSYTKRTLRYRDLTNGQIQTIPLGRR